MKCKLTRKHRHSSKLLIGLPLIGILLLPSISFAKEEISYNPFISTLKNSNAADPKAAVTRDRAEVAARILEQPLRPFGHLFGKSAEWVERHHVDKKFIWFVDELELRGIHPKLKAPNEGSFGTFGFKGRLDVDRFLKVEQPHFSLDLFGGWTPSVGFNGTDVEAGTNYELNLPGFEVYHKGLVRYSRSSSESFYGIGSNTSLGEWSTYEPEELWLEATLGRKVSQSWDGGASFIYQRVNIGNGNRKGVGKIKEHFANAGVPGLDGGDLIGARAYLDYDVRDHTSDPKRGGYGGLGVTYFQNLDGDDFQYVNVKGSLAHFFTLGSDRRVLALRLSGETNQEVNGDEVPFYNFPRLGGAEPWDGSELLRSYRFNRYFDKSLAVTNAEYRYSVYEYGDFQADSFMLFDIGEVFDDAQDFAFGDLAYSYGSGINIKFRRKTILALIVSHGSEGLSFEVNSKVSF
jgi:hypothetical protein